MSPLWNATLAALLVLGIAAFGVWLYRRWQRRPSGRDDRYMPERLLSPEQASMLEYLQNTFPGQLVLPRVKLKDMLSIRRAADEKLAQERLQQTVDFVVCGKDGRPLFAFDVEQYHLSNAKAKEFEIKMKNRMLKTAGVRFVFLKNSTQRMPASNDFRRQLDLAALPQPKPSDPKENESVRQRLEAKLSNYDRMFPSTGFREAEVMGLSGLMNLDQDDLLSSRRWASSQGADSESPAAEPDTRPPPAAPAARRPGAAAAPASGKVRPR